MARKSKAPLWRGRFLRALRRSANVRLAARMAGVDHSSAYALRKRDADFAARWARAVAKGRVNAGGEGSGLTSSAAAQPPLHQPSPKAAAGHEQVETAPGSSKPRPGRGGLPIPPAARGEELVVRRSKKGTQLVKAGAGRWNAGAEARFFAELGRTACVERAAEAAGFSATALYNRRKAYPDFAEKWRIAEEEARARLHRLVVAAGIARFDPTASWGEGLPQVSMSEAIAILRLKGPPAPSGSGGAAGGARHGIEEPTIEQVRDEVLRRLAALRRQGGDGAGEEG